MFVYVLEAVDVKERMSVGSVLWRGEYDSRRSHDDEEDEEERGNSTAAVCWEPRPWDAVVVPASNATLDRARLLGIYLQL